MKCSLFCQRYQRINMPVSMVMLKIENKFIARAGKGSVAVEDIPVDFPDISISGTNAALGNSMANSAKELFPIKNR